MKREVWLPHKSTGINVREEKGCIKSRFASPRGPWALCYDTLVRFPSTAATLTVLTGLP